MAHLGVGMGPLRQGNVQKALPQLERAMDICQQADLPLYFPLLAAPLGTAYLLSGRIADAASLLEKALQQALQIGFKQRQAVLLAELAEAALLAGHQEVANAHAQEALVLSRARKQRGHEATILHLLGHIARHRDVFDEAQAEAHYQQALILANKLGMRPLQAHCHRCLGTLYCQTGQAEHARAELSMAIQMYRDMEMTFWLPETEAALAEVEGR
jgi:tetratricopeptide (TPR) repeat protein